MESPNGELLQQYLQRNRPVGADQAAVWANSAAVNTPVDVDYAAPVKVQSAGIKVDDVLHQKDARYLIVIDNPSAVTALTVVVKNKHAAFGGSDKFGEVTTINVPISAVKDTLVDGWLLGDGARLTLSNDTVLGALDGFTATIRVIAP